MNLLELAHVAEQEHMRNAMMAQARREARRGRKLGRFGRIVRRR